MDESYAVNNNHSNQHQNAMLMQMQEQHQQNQHENFNYQQREQEAASYLNHYQQKYQENFLNNNNNSQNIQNPNYYYINYNQLQQQRLHQQQHQQPPGYYQINQAKINNQLPMDTAQNNQIFFNNNFKSSILKFPDEPSSLQSTPHSTPSVSSLSLSSNSSIQSFGVSESNSNKNLNGRSVIATIYDTNDHRPHGSLPMKKQQNEMNLLNSSQENHSISLKRSNDASFTSLPKYVKPKICKSSLIIQSVSSKQIAKPQPQLATLPSSQYATNMPSKANGNNNNTIDSSLQLQTFS